MPVVAVRVAVMFVGIQTRRQRRLLWATPLLFAALWVAYIVSAMRAPAGRIATALDLIGHLAHDLAARGARAHRASA